MLNKNKYIFSLKSKIDKNLLSSLEICNTRYFKTIDFNIVQVGDSYHIRLINYNYHRFLFNIRDGTINRSVKLNFKRNSNN